MRLALRTAFAALAVVSCLGAGASPARSAACPKLFCGLQAWSDPTPAGYETMQRGRVGVYRQFAFWSRIEQVPGEYDWRGLDVVARDSARVGIPLLLVLHSSPDYVRSSDPRVRDHSEPPKTRAGRKRFALYAAEVAKRYRRSSSFWQASGVEPVTIRYQLWNEPNGSTHLCPRSTTKCPPKATPGEYRKLVEAAAPAIRRADPAAAVGLAGMAQTKRGTGLRAFFRGMYGSRRTRANRFAGLFDAVGLHPYARTPKDSARAIELVRSLMDRAGDRSGRIWLTELGWGTGGRTKNPAYASRREQARKLAGSFSATLRDRRRLGIGMIVWFCWQDRVPTEEEARIGHWQPFAGLFSAGGEPKPSWGAFVKLTGGRAGGAVGPPAQGG